jgi:hypothetical protein
MASQLGAVEQSTLSLFKSYHTERKLKGIVIT